ncbi:MAG: hypothetical protein QOI60_1353 [Actinomycetota bacterium]|nr:hypothetical protein [Actinomycetota bacterium]MEA2556741.1 hypothetical protein [Actinomycetota bacterium]MEA2579778.1 hypothetical protein [Actinomycetota bacterium]
MFPKEEGERRIEIPEDLTPEEERAILMALERYFSQESPKPTPWVLQGRVDATGHGTLQVRKYSRDPWNGVQAAFVRRGVPSMNGRGDVR